jgi:hypothetical protein
VVVDLRIQQKEYIAFRCYQCNVINVFPSSHQDGHKCLACNGYLLPIGNAIVGIDLGKGEDKTVYPRVKKAKKLWRFGDR